MLSKNDANQVYMAASTGGKFTRRFKVLESHYDDPTVIVCSGSNYQPWKRQFGFGIVKEVPLMQDDDHDYDVPDSVHKIEKKEKNKKSRGKPDEVLNRALKIRNDADNTSIDIRLTIKDAKERLENGKTFGNGHRSLVLFTRGDGPNISDHYDMAKYTAIACVSKTEQDELKDHDRVLTPEGFQNWSKSALIATEDGAMTPKELVDDDRMVVFLYREYSSRNHKRTDKAELLREDKAKLRHLYCEDIRDQISWTKVLDNYDGGYGGDDESDVDDSEKADTLFAIAGDKVLKRAEWAFDQLDTVDRTTITGLRLGHPRYASRRPFSWERLDGSRSTYQLMSETPNWDNNSNIYDLFPSNHDSDKANMYLGFHDLGIDPSEKDSEELREIISG